MWKILFYITYAHIVACVICMRTGNMENIHDEQKYGIRKRFALMIDAGSTGSRMFVYTWDLTRDGFANLSTLRLFSDSHGNPLVRKVTPGLSSFHEDPSGIRVYLYRLLDLAASEIPPKYHAETLLYVLATAGMRLLKQSEQDMIMNEVRNAVKSKYHFKFEDSYAETITGDEEALFGWIAINYILGSFSSSDKKIRPTHGMLDMGGASMQIAFAVSSTQPVPKESSMKFEYFIAESQKVLKYRVFAASYLNYGMQEFRNLYTKELVKELQSHIQKNETSNAIQILDPCINKGLEFSTNVSIQPRQEPTANVTSLHSLVVHFVGKGDFDQCYEKIAPLLKVGTGCQPLLCSINGNKQPEINFNNTEFYGITEFLYALQDVLPGNSSIYNFNKLMPKVKKLCAEPWNVYLDRLHKMRQPVSNEEFDEILRLKNLACFKAVYVLAALHVGFHFPKDYDKLHPVSHLRGTEIQWNLGALVYILNHQQHDILQTAFKNKITFLVVALFILAFSIILILAIVLRERRRERNSFAMPVECLHLTRKHQANSTIAVDPNSPTVHRAQQGIGETAMHNPNASMQANSCIN